MLLTLPCLHSIGSSELICYWPKAPKIYELWTIEFKNASFWLKRQSRTQRQKHLSVETVRKSEVVNLYVSIISFGKHKLKTHLVDYAVEPIMSLKYDLYGFDVFLSENAYSLERAADCI